MSTHDAERPASAAEVRRWLTVVDVDLAAVRLCLGAEPMLAEMAALHCQQALEKTAKAWLKLAGTGFRKTHGIDELAGQVAAVDRTIGDELTRLAWRWCLGLGLGRASDKVLTSFRHPPLRHSDDR